MPPVIAGAGVIALGSVAGAAVVKTVLLYAAIGAVVGTATALISGGDVRDGAIKGALMGAVSGGIMGAVGQAGAASQAVGQTTAGSVSAAGPGMNPMNPGIVAQGQIPQTAGMTGGAAGGLISPNLTQQAPTAPPSTGLLSRLGGWIETNPQSAAIMSQTLGGAAQGMQESRTSRKEIEAIMERDRLNREHVKIGGLADSKVQPPNYRIDKFMDKPQWQDDGLLSARA